MKILLIPNAFNLDAATLTAISNCCSIIKEDASVVEYKEELECLLEATKWELVEFDGNFYYDEDEEIFIIIDGKAYYLINNIQTYAVKNHLSEKNRIKTSNSKNYISHGVNIPATYFPYDEKVRFVGI